MERKTKIAGDNALVSELKFCALYWKGFHLIGMNTVFCMEVHAVPNFASLLL